VIDDFQTRLARGSSLLGAGDAGAARAELLAALSLQPQDPGVRGLLAQAEFRLGEYETAARIYDGLVQDHPTDPALHVNLGLVHLKAGRLDEAIRAFRDACDLAPDHRKARSYLGLALARRGDPAAAREEFLRAGEEAMARRMERLLEAVDAPADEPQPAMVGPRPDGEAEELAEVAAGGLARLEIDEQPFAPAPESEAEEGWQVAGPPPTEPLPPGSPGLLPPPLARIPALSTFLDLARLPLPPDGPFATGSFGAAIEVRGGIFTRLDGVYAARGELHFEPVRKRFRGRELETPFGEGERQVFRAAGRGSLLVSPEDPAGGTRTLTAVRLSQEEALFCEGPVFAFDESLDHENGRISGTPADLALVRLRGTGHVLLATARRIRTLSVAGEPLRVPAGRLVGWVGNLVPRLLPFGGAGGGAGLGVELAGEGDVLLVP
jgi:uncharacterized protein (AIM24 family)